MLLVALLVVHLHKSAIAPHFQMTFLTSGCKMEKIKFYIMIQPLWFDFTGSGFHLANHFFLKVLLFLEVSTPT